ncbi:MAG: TetR/AcrR family transcriptional regulator [Ignavibacteria bacterium]|jgi:AcrR family transcriptional regulator
MSPIIVNKPEKKEIILNAAIKVFAKNGVRNTKIIDIANTAGVGKGTVYEYFSSKEEIFETAFEFSMAKYIDLLKQVAKSDIDPEKKLKRIIKDIGSMMEAESYLTEITFHFWAEGIRVDKENLNAELKKFYKDSKKIIKSIIQEGIKDKTFKKVNADYSATIMISVFDGLLLQWIYNKGFSVSKMIVKIENIILNELKA